MDDRPPGLEDPADRLTEEEAAALAAARLIEEAEAEAETRHLGGGAGGEAGEGADTLAPRLNPPGPPPGLPPNVAGITGLPPGKNRHRRHFSVKKIMSLIVFVLHFSFLTYKKLIVNILQMVLKILLPSTLFKNSQFFT